MRKIISIGIFLTINLWMIVVWAHLPNEQLTQGNTTINEMLKKAMPAVVNIVNQGQITITDDPFLKHELSQLKAYSALEDKPFVSFGSGVIINAQKGLIVTNAHVVDLDKKITVTLSDGRHFSAKKVGADNKTDIAVIQIEATHLTELPLANSDKVQVGDFVIAIGSPFELNQTVTSGVVSALHRSIGIEEGFENFIQTDAPINMGNSGGALIDMNGKLIGINTALLSPNAGGGNIGIGFAIPSNMMNGIVNQILKYGSVTHGILGIMVQNLTPDLATAFHMSGQKGALVSQTLPGSPAEKAGIKMGDVITQINSEAITSNDAVHNLLGLLRVGEEAKVAILRGGKSYQYSVKIADPEKLDKEASKSKAVKPFLYGVHLENVIEQNSYHGYYQAVRVLDVDPYSSAWISGLRPDDIIVSANHQPVSSIQELDQWSQEDKEGLLLGLLRNKNTIFVVVK